MSKMTTLGAYMEEEEARLLANARAEIAAEQADPAHHARVLAKIAEDEAAPDPLAQEEEPDEEDDEDGDGD